MGLDIHLYACTEGDFKLNNHVDSFVCASSDFKFENSISRNLTRVIKFNSDLDTEYTVKVDYTKNSNKNYYAITALNLFELGVEFANDITDDFVSSLRLFGKTSDISNRTTQTLTDFTDKVKFRRDNKKVYFKFTVAKPFGSSTATILSFMIARDSSATKPKFKVTQNLENCTSDFSESELAENTEQTFTLTANEGYYFEQKPTLNDKEFSLNGDKYPTTATITETATSDIAINATATEKPKTHNIVRTGIFKNATCNRANGFEFVEGENISLIITAKQGFEFANKDYKFKGTSSDYPQKTMEYSKSELKLNLKNFTTDVILNDDYSAVESAPITDTISSFIHCYIVNDEILTSLSKERLFNFSGDTAQTVDYGVYITECYKLPLNLTSVTSGTTKKIKLGNKTTQVLAPTATKSTLDVDLGVIKIDEKYHNSYDYDKVNCVLYAPFIEPFNIETEYCINQELHIYYRIDLYTGECTIYGESSFTRNIVFSRNQNIKKDLPFIQKQTEKTINKIGSFIDNGIRCAYIEVTRNIPVVIDSVYGHKCNEYGTIEDYKGYIEIDDVELNIVATNSEKDEIEQLLKEGIFINAL